MNTELLLTALGALLVLSALLGGGFEIREIKVPQIGGFARAAAAVIGLTCLTFGIVIALNANKPDRTTANLPARQPSEPADPSSPDAKPVKFKVSNNLGEGQLSEKVVVSFNGHRVGELTVDTDHPSTTLPVSLEPGSHNYSLGSLSREVDVDGDEVAIQRGGRGTVDIQEGDDFSVVWTSDEQSIELEAGVD